MIVLDVVFLGKIPAKSQARKTKRGCLCPSYFFRKTILQLLHKQLSLKQINVDADLFAI